MATLAKAYSQRIADKFVAAGWVLHGKRWVDEELELQEYDFEWTGEGTPLDPYELPLDGPAVTVTGYELKLITSSLFVAVGGGPTPEDITRFVQGQRDALESLATTCGDVLAGLWLSTDLQQHTSRSNQVLPLRRRRSPSRCRVSMLCCLRIC